MLLYKLDEDCRPINLNHYGASMRMLFVQEYHPFLTILSFCNCETQTALFTHLAGTSKASKHRKTNFDCIGPELRLGRRMSN